MTNVIVVIGAGSIGQAIARRVSVGKHVLLADLRQQNTDAAAKVLNDAGFEVSTASVDVSSRESVHALVQTATALGDVTGVIHAAGVSPTQASPATILKVDLYGTALVLEELGNVIARGGAGKAGRRCWRKRQIAAAGDRGHRRLDGGRGVTAGLNLRIGDAGQFDAGLASLIGDEPERLQSARAVDAQQREVAVLVLGGAIGVAEP